MPIKVNLAVILAQRAVKSKDLAAHVGITDANLSLLKQGKVKGVRFETLAAICAYLDCQPATSLNIQQKSKRPPPTKPAVDAHWPLPV